MKIKVKNLGVLRQAEFETGDLTIICGRNNTGKTYTTYALYGFLASWRELMFLEIERDKLSQLFAQGSTTIELQKYIVNITNIVDTTCKRYIDRLPTVFSSSKNKLSDASFNISINPDEICLVDSFEKQVSSRDNILFSLIWSTDNGELKISLIGDKEALRQLSFSSIQKIITDDIKNIILSKIFPNPFIASAERTGATIFRKDLNLARNRLLEQMNSVDKESDAFALLFKSMYSEYAIPVKDNVDFARQLEDISKKDSFLNTEHQELLSDFSNILGGEFTVTKNDELFFSPQGQKAKLTMDESSSSVRSLLEIGFYLRHVAKPGDFLMIDEPELNLHPENQRLMARLLARLVNVGIKVFITTHSDYIIKELNTLIMLNQDKPALKKIAEKEGYKSEELLSSDRVKVYIAKEDLVKLNGMERRTLCITLVPAEIFPNLGIKVESFDTAIDDMNRIQDSIEYCEVGDS